MPDNNVKDSRPLKKKLLEMRLEHGFKQKEMARDLGLPFYTYRSYEYGKKHPGKLAAVELERRISQWLQSRNHQ